MFNQKSKAMEISINLAYVMNSRTCRALKTASTSSPATELMFDLLNAYCSYFEATETAKVKLLDDLQSIAGKYNITEDSITLVN